MASPAVVKVHSPCGLAVLPPKGGCLPLVPPEMMGRLKRGGQIDRFDTVRLRKRRDIERCD